MPALQPSMDSILPNKPSKEQKTMLGTTAHYGQNVSDMGLHSRFTAMNWDAPLPGDFR